MSTFTLPSGQDHHFQDKAFKRSFYVSFAIHAVILAVAGGMTLFSMSGTTYVPSYTVDLISVPAPKPAPAAKPAPAVKKPPKAAQKKPVVEKTAPKPAQSPPLVETAEEMKASRGDESARVERRKKIEELELEARRLYESFTAEEAASAEETVQPEEAAVEAPPSTGTPAGGNEAPSNLRFRAYYDRIWAKIRSSWVVPEGVTSRTSLVTVVGIRIAANGEIEQFWIEEKSGNEYYDQSALRAIRKANPLPSLPDGYNDRSLEVGINFRYPE